MTSIEVNPVQPNERSMEFIESLARKLEMSLTAERACVLLVVYNARHSRDHAQAGLRDYLIGLNQEVDHIRVEDEAIANRLYFLIGLRNPEHTVFFVDDLQSEQNEPLNIYALLNSQKDVFTERRLRIVFWLTRNEAENFARHAPDLWAQRGCLVELDEDTEVGRALMQTVESVWLEPDDQAARSEDIKAKAASCDAFFNQLPQNVNTITARAYWYLTMGILYWRKGSHEMADWLLEEALKSAAKTQDSRLEAKCFNAIALVKIGLGSVDNAFDAYKQALRLAPDQFSAWNNLGRLYLKNFRNDGAMIAFQKAIAHDPKDSIGWNGLGKAYFAVGYMDDAVAAYQKAISYLSTFAEPWNNLGEVYSALGRSVEAIKAYSKAIELDKCYLDPWLGLGNLLLKQGKYLEAIKAFQGALKLDSKNSTVWNQLGCIYLKCESYQNAAEVFSKAIQLNPEDGWALHNLALTYTHQEKYSEAVPLYLKSIDIFHEEKGKAASWNELANVYRLLNDYDNAIAAYQIADSLDPRIRAWRNNNLVARTKSSERPVQILNSEEKAENVNPSKIGEHHILSNESGVQMLVDSENQMTKGAEMSKLISVKEIQFQNRLVNHDCPPKSGSKEDNAPGWNAQGNVHFKRGEIEAAIQAYNRAIQLDSTFGWPYSNLGAAYQMQGQYAEAIVLYKKSLELLGSDKDKAVSWNGLGNVFRCLNEYENAVVAYQKAAQLDPETAGIRDGTSDVYADQGANNAQSWNNLGEAFFRAGKYDKAVHAYNKALRLDPNDGWAYANLALILLSQGQFGKAISLYQKAVPLMKSDKDKAVVLNRLGNAYRKNNDYDNAVKMYQQAVLLADEGVSLLTRTRFSLLSNCNID